MHIYTIRTISQELGQPMSRISYALARAGIVADAHAGIARLFTSDQMDEIRAAVSDVTPRDRKKVAAQ